MLKRQRCRSRGGNFLVDAIDLINRKLDLRFNIRGQVIDIDDPVAPGIRQLKSVPAVFDRNADAVTRDPGGRIHNGNEPVGQHVQQAGLADIRPADDGDEWQRHRFRSCKARGVAAHAIRSA